MKSYLKQLKSDLRSFSKYDRLLLGAVISLFCTQVVTAVYLVVFLIISFRDKELGPAIRKQPGYQLIYPFIALEVIVTLFYQNFTGLVNALGMLLVLLFVAVYRTRIHHRLFLYCVDLMLVCSILVGIYALFQFQIFSQAGGYSFFEFHIQNSPRRRIMATFDNANFYATLLEFWIYLCMYRFFHHKGILMRGLYVVIALFDFFLLVLTGCRTALLPFAVGIPAFLWLSKEKRWFCVALGVLAVALAAVFNNPNLIPRITDMSTLESRIEIWTCAWIGICQYPIFGMGPQTYHLYYQMYDGHKAPHCHNIYLDSLCSYGIVGTVLYWTYLIFVTGKEIIRSRNVQDRYLFGLCIAFILVFLIHGLLDVTISVLSTSVVFFMVLNTIGPLAEKS